jgi:phosphatidylserine/phosphatidylglycerophosphate/cardiolipin synthase-like enzyme
VKRLVLSAFGLCLFTASAFAPPAFAGCDGVSMDVCFRPGANACDREVVEAINGARRTLLVQAYGFTHPQIVSAIGNAKKRGVDVRVILDKTNLPAKNGKSRYTGLTYLENAHVPVRIDDRVAIAHNKVMVIDGQLVIGGSYNYTRSAEERNAENVTFSRSACIANVFRDNFERRWTASAPVS